MNISVDVSVFERGRKRPEYTLVSDLKGEVTLQELLQFTKSTLIITADEVLKEEQDAGFDQKPILAVDGKVGKPILTVSPLGQIEFTARQNFSEIALAVYEGLLHRSKVLTGFYKSQHFVFLNGQQVATDMSQLKAWLATNPQVKDNDLLRFVNIAPYARRLERYGVTAQRSRTNYEDLNRRSRKTKPGLPVKLSLAPNGTYFLTAKAVKQKFKRNIDIKFTFLTGTSLGIGGVFKKSGRRGKNSVGRSYLYPSIVLRVKERGIL